VSALGPSEISAWRRPFAVLAIAGLRLFAGFCLALPFSSLVASTGIGMRAEGDRALFEGGGYLLLELLRLHVGELVATARGLMPLLLLGLVLTCACNVALLIALDVRERLPSREWLALTWARLPAQLVVVTGAALAQLVLVFAGSVAIGAIPEPLAKPVATTLGQIAVLVLIAVLAGAVGGFADVTKASLVRHEAPLSQSLARGWSCVRSRPISACFGWVPWAAPFVLAGLLAARLSEVIDVSRPGLWRIASVFLVHQLVILVGVACRAAWFARALRLVASTSKRISASA
jgi:hypothetical protein